MKHALDNIHYYLFSIFTGIVIAGVIYLIVAKSGLIVWVYDHETLTAGLLALAAATVTVFLLHKQIQETRKIEDERRRSKLEAERSVLAHALDDLSCYAGSCLAQAKEMASNNTSSPKAPTLSLESIHTVKACIEFAPLQPRSRMMSLLNNIQVGRSMLSDEISEYVGRVNRCETNDYTPDEKLKYNFNSAATFVEVSLQIQSLWDFARSESPDDFTTIGFLHRISRILHPQKAGYLVWQDFAEYLSNHLDEKDYLAV